MDFLENMPLGLTLQVLVGLVVLGIGLWIVQAATSAGKILAIVPILGGWAVLVSGLLKTSLSQWMPPSLLEWGSLGLWVVWSVVLIKEKSALAKIIGCAGILVAILAGSYLIDGGLWLPEWLSAILDGFKDGFYRILGLAEAGAKRGP